MGLPTHNKDAQEFLSAFNCNDDQSNSKIIAKAPFQFAERNLRNPLSPKVNVNRNSYCHQNANLSSRQQCVRPLIKDLDLSSPSVHYLQPHQKSTDLESSSSPIPLSANMANAVTKSRKRPYSTTSTKPPLLTLNAIDDIDPQVTELIEAMRDMTDTEDNQGMLAIWGRLMDSKAAKIERVCEDLLATAKNAHEHYLGEKAPINHYRSFDRRLKAICQTLRTQKTVCKHLLEDPYSYQVVDDPINASKRVQNNRKVNEQKKEAISVGRQRLSQIPNKRSRIVKIENESEQDEVLSGQELPASKRRKTMRKTRSLMDNTSDSHSPGIVPGHRFKHLSDNIESVFSQDTATSGTEASGSPLTRAGFEPRADSYFGRTPEEGHGLPLSGPIFRPYFGNQQPYWFQSPQIWGQANDQPYITHPCQNVAYQDIAGPLDPSEHIANAYHNEWYPDEYQDGTQQEKAWARDAQDKWVPET